VAIGDFIFYGIATLDKVSATSSIGGLSVRMVQLIKLLLHIDFEISRKLLEAYFELGKDRSQSDHPFA
jgi:hypothetical protein